MKYLSDLLIMIPVTVVYFGMLFVSAGIFWDGVKNFKNGFGLDLDLIGAGMIIMLLLGMGLAVVSST